jgi:hypothetical protein
MTETSAPGRYEIRSEAHGPHWVAWVVRGSDGKPDRSVVLVGETQAEAEQKARDWADRRV